MRPEQVPVVKMMRSEVLAAWLLEDKDWTFRADLKSREVDVVDYPGPDALDVEFEARVTVTWEADFDVRSYGIKGISPVIRSVMGKVDVVDMATQRLVTTIQVSWPAASASITEPVLSPTASAKDLLLHFGGDDQKWELLDSDLEAPGQWNWNMYPVGVTLNLKDHTIKVQF